MSSIIHLNCSTKYSSHAGMFFASTMVMVSVALVMAVIVTNIYAKRNSSERCPEWALRLASRSFPTHSLPSTEAPARHIHHFRQPPSNWIRESAMKDKRKIFDISYISNGRFASAARQGYSSESAAATAPPTCKHGFHIKSDVAAVTYIAVCSAGNESITVTSAMSSYNRSKEVIQRVATPARNGEIGLAPKRNGDWSPCLQIEYFCGCLFA